MYPKVFWQFGKHIPDFDSYSSVWLWLNLDISGEFVLHSTPQTCQDDSLPAVIWVCTCPEAVIILHDSQAKSIMTAKLGRS